MLNKKCFLTVVFSLILIVIMGTGLVYAGDELDDYYMYDELDDIEVFEEMQQVVADDPVPVSVDVPGTVEIAMIYPALDGSDSWPRGYEGITGRLEDLEIPYNISIMGSDHGEHDVQRAQLKDVLAGSEEFDYVIVGPSVLGEQKEVIEELIADPGLEVIIWNETTPLKDWGESREEGQPLSWVGFDHLFGARLMGEYITENYNPDKKVAMMYGPPGSITAMRGYEAKDIMEDYGMEIVAEHYADFDFDLAYYATFDILDEHDDIDKIHSVSTAMTDGIATALRELGKDGDIVVNGWGGGTIEQELIRSDEVEFTVLRNQDDWGVVLAEIIKYDLEDRKDEIPIVFSGEMQLIDHMMDQQDIDSILEHAFRYSKEELGF